MRSEIPLVKTAFALQIDINWRSLLAYGWKPMSSSLVQCWDLIWLVLVYHKHAAAVSLSPVVSESFLGVIHPIQQLQSFCLLFPEPQRARFHEDIPFRTAWHFELSHSAYIIKQWVSLLIPIYCKRNLSHQIEQDTALCVQRMVLGVVLLLWSLSRTIIFGWPQAFGLSSLRFLATCAVSGMSTIPRSEPHMQSDTI